MEIKKGPELEFDPKSIAIATSTFYPKWYPDEIKDYDRVDKIRGDLAIRLLDQAKKNEYRMVVVDGGSSQEFIEELKKIGIAATPELEKGMSPARQQAFKEAGGIEGVRVICWTEPEKVSIIQDCLPQGVAPILRGEADIVIPKRDEAVLKTYPDPRVAFERRGNKVFNDILRKHNLLSTEEDLDVFFGPRFFRNDPEIVNLFLGKYEFEKRDLKLDQIVDPKLWPNALFLPIVAALHQGFRVVSVNVPYRHPIEQTNVEKDDPKFKRKSDVQFKNIITSTIHLIRMLKGSSKTRLSKRQ